MECESRLFRRRLALRVGRVFGLDIYGLDLVETPRGWTILDVNDFPGFAKVPHAAQRIANTIVRISRSNKKPQQRVGTALHRRIGLEASA